MRRRFLATENLAFSGSGTMNTFLQQPLTVRPVHRSGGFGSEPVDLHSLGLVQCAGRYGNCEAQERFTEAR